MASIVESPFARFETGRGEPGYVSAMLITCLFDYCEKRGVDPCALFTEPRAAAADPLTLIPHERVRRLLASAAKHFDDPDFAVNLGASLRIEHLGMLGFALRASRSLQEALVVMQRYDHLLSPEHQVRMRVEHKVLELYWGPALTSRAIVEEANICGFVQIVRTLANTDAVPLFVGFTGAPPASAAAYERFFGCEVKFAQPYASIRAPEHYLKAMLQRGERALLTVLERELVKVEASRTVPQTFEKTVARLVEKLAANGVPTAEEVADRLNTTVRQLNQTLANEGKLYRDVRDATLRKMSERYLADHQLSLGEVAQRLGYSEQSAFTRSFRRWAGVSPRAWRRRTQRP